MAHGKRSSVRCPKCGYVWETRSRLTWVTCPNCLRKFSRGRGQVGGQSEKS